MSYVIPNDLTVRDLLSRVFVNWPPATHTAVVQAIHAYSENIQIAEDLRLLMVASPSRGHGEPRPTLWIPFCKAVHTQARVFDPVAQHNLKIKLMDKSQPSIATPEVGMGEAESSGCSSSSVTMSAQEFAAILRGGQGLRKPTSALNVEEQEQRTNQQIRSRDVAIGVQKELLASEFSTRILFPQDTKGRYRALNRCLHALLTENMEKCGQDASVWPLWQGEKSRRGQLRSQLLELADARCAIRPRAAPKREDPQEDDAIVLTDSEDAAVTPDGRKKRVKVEDVTTKRVKKRKTASFKRQEMESLTSQETNLRQQEKLYRAAIARQVKNKDEVKAAEITAQLNTILQQQHSVSNSLDAYRRGEEKAVKKSMARTSKGVAEWEVATEGTVDIIRDRTEWNEPEGSHLAHVLPADTLLCAQLRASVAEIRNREGDIYHACTINGDTFVGQMPLMPRDYLRARKAYCHLLQHPDNCLCQTDIKIVTAVLQADVPYTCKGLMKKVGIDPNVVSTANFQKRMIALPVWCFMPVAKVADHSSHWIVMPKEEGIDYAKHSHFLQLMGPLLRYDFTVSNNKPERCLVSKEDLKAFKLMCSTPADGRILEAALFRDLSNTEIKKHYGRKFAKVRKETREALTVVKSMMRSVDVMLDDHNKGSNCDGQRMLSLLEREFGVTDDKLNDALAHVSNLIDIGDVEEGEGEGVCNGFFSKLVDDMQDTIEGGSSTMDENQLVEHAVEKLTTGLGQHDFECISDDEEEELNDDDEGVLLRDLQTVLCTDNTNGIRFKRFEKAVNEEVTKLAAELGGTEMKRVEKLCDVFEILKSQEIAEEEEDIYAGDDVDDDHLAFDALDISRMYEELNVTQLVAARKVQHKRALQRRLKQKCVGLMFRKGWRPCNVQRNIEKYPDLCLKVTELLRQQGHGANKWRHSSEEFAIHKSNAKGSGYRAVHRGLLAAGYKVGYSSMIYLGHHNNSCMTEKGKYQEVVSMRMRQMVKRFVEDNVDRKYQIAQYACYNEILTTLQQAEDEVDVLIAERDDHAIKRAGTGASSNQKRVLQEHDSEVWEPTHDYANVLMTKLQATATLFHGLGFRGGVPVDEKQVLYTKALQVTPSSSHQLMHDLYRQLEDPSLSEIFYNSDGHIKRVQHWRVDGGGNEAINSSLNRILWVEYMERTGVDCLLVSHCESGGNIRELVERLQACVTQAQQGHFFPFDEETFADPNTAKLDPDIIAGYHLANNAKYAELIDGAEGLHNCRLQAKESNRVVDEQSCPKCPPHFWERAPFFYEYFHSRNQTASKKQAVVDALPEENKKFLKEAQHLEALLKRHMQFGMGRYSFFLSRCCGGDVNCPSVKCSSSEPWMCPDQWCDHGPPTYSSGVIYPQYDPEKEGSYMPPHQLWDAYSRGQFRNGVETFLPSALLKERWQAFTQSNKAKALTMSESSSVAQRIKDSYITQERVFNYFKKQRLVHLRQVAGQAKKKVARKDNETAVPLCSTSRICLQAPATSDRNDVTIVDPAASTSNLDNTEDDEPGDPDWPYSITKAEEIFKVRHFPTLDEASLELKELMHLSGSGKGKLNRGKLVNRQLMYLFQTEGWWAGWISSFHGQSEALDIKQNAAHGFG